MFVVKDKKKTLLKVGIIRHYEQSEVIRPLMVNNSQIASCLAKT